MNADRFFKPQLKAVSAYGLVQEKAGVKLNQNESPFDLPEPLKQVVFDRLRERPWNRYTQALPNRVIQLLAEQNDWPAEGIILGAGSNLLLELLTFAAAGEGQTVLAPTPCFSLYELITRLAGVQFSAIPFSTPFVYDAGPWLEGIAAHQPAVIFLCSPNNPTGSCMAGDDVAAIAEAAAGLVVVDEAYREFAGEDRRDLLDRFDNLILVRTFSKAQSSAGIRLGYMMARPDVTDVLRKIVPPFNINVLTATVAEVLLERPEWTAETVARILSEKERMTTALSAMPGVTVFPSGANFFLVATAWPADTLAEKLAERSILVRTAHDEALARMIRVNVGTAGENNAFLAGLQEILSEGQVQ